MAVWIQWVQWVCKLNLHGVLKLWIHGHFFLIWNVTLLLLFSSKMTLEHTTEAIHNRKNRSYTQMWWSPRPSIWGPKLTWIQTPGTYANVARKLYEHVPVRGMVLSWCPRVTAVLLKQYKRSSKHNGMHRTTRCVPYSDLSLHVVFSSVKRTITIPLIGLQ